jgi:hypothetical protein
LKSVPSQHTQKAQRNRLLQVLAVIRCATLATAISAQEALTNLFQGYGLKGGSPINARTRRKYHHALEVYFKLYWAEEHDRGSAGGRMASLTIEPDLDEEKRVTTIQVNYDWLEAN